MDHVRVASQKSVSLQGIFLIKDLSPVMSIYIYIYIYILDLSNLEYDLSQSLDCEFVSECG
jgi:hypothetical protein